VPTQGGGAGARRRGRGDMRRPLLPGSGPLAGLPPVLVFLVVAVVFAVAVFVGGPIGALLLALLAVGVAVLLATTWARLSPPERLARAFVLAVLVAVTIGVALR
jgi:Ca2+/H+ antiporter